MVKHVMKKLKKLLKIKKKKGKLIKSKLGDKYSIAKHLKGKLDALRSEMEAADLGGIGDTYLEAMLRDNLPGNNTLETDGALFIKNGDVFSYLDASRGTTHDGSTMVERIARWGSLPTVARVWVKASLVKHAAEDSAKFKAAQPAEPKLKPSGKKKGSKQTTQE